MDGKPSVTRLLASAASYEEAEVLQGLGVDILDLKNPSQGALGALDPKIVASIVQGFPDQIISATVGDLPMDPRTIESAVLEMAATGVSYVKIGFFPRPDDWPSILSFLAPHALHGLPLIAVFFGDHVMDLEMLPQFKAAGFQGVMVDTADKHFGGLLVHRDLDWLEAFVHKARSLELLTGLAGSLSLADVPALRSLEPDYLGFRGALCHGDRTGQINPDAVRQVRQAISAP
jgi:dihydroneopterin aldolase